MRETSLSIRLVQFAVVAAVALALTVGHIRATRLHAYPGGKFSVLSVPLIIPTAALVTFAIWTHRRDRRRKRFIGLILLAIIVSVVLADYAWSIAYVSFGGGFV